jgi:hypothetical protein
MRKRLSQIARGSFKANIFDFFFLHPERSLQCHNENRTTEKNVQKSMESKLRQVSNTTDSLFSHDNKMYTLKSLCYTSTDNGIGET